MRKKCKKGKRVVLDEKIFILDDPVFLYSACLVPTPDTYFEPLDSAFPSHEIDSRFARSLVAAKTKCGTDGRHHPSTFGNETLVEWRRRLLNHGLVSRSRTGGTALSPAFQK